MENLEMKKGEIQKKKDEASLFLKNCFDLPIDEFILGCKLHLMPCSYGAKTQQKIIFDAGGKLQKVLPSMDLGDVTIRNIRFYEIKTIFMTEDRDFIRITNIRDYQPFDYFIFCLVDENYIIDFYCLHKNVIVENDKFVRLNGMNGTQAANKDNKTVSKSATIDKKYRKDVFDKNNILRDTSYNALMDYISYMYDVSGPVKITEKKNKVGVSKKRVKASYKTRRKYAPKRSVKFSINDQIIKGKTNCETMINLVNSIGVDTAKQNIWPSMFSDRKTSDSYVKLESGIYFNPRFSYRDIKMISRNFTKHGLNVKLIT
jgi:hypothetical protein